MRCVNDAELSDLGAERLAHVLIENCRQLTSIELGMPNLIVQVYDLHLATEQLIGTSCANAEDEAIRAGFGS